MRRLWVLGWLIGGVAWAGAAPAVDPHAEMAAALEAQADVSPAPASFPEQAAVDPAGRGGGSAIGVEHRADAAAKRAAIQAAHAAALELAKSARGQGAQAAAQAAAHRAAKGQGHGPGGPPPKKH